MFDAKAEKNSHRKNLGVEKDPRKNPRRPSAKLVYFAYQSKYCKGVIKNICGGGAFIETKAEFPTVKKLKLVIPGAKEYFMLQGKIIHFNQKGFGIKFKSISKVRKRPETSQYQSSSLNERRSRTKSKER